MTSGRFFTPLFLILALLVLSPSLAFSFWGFGETEGKSGLNLDQGYDLNTVSTIRGKVVFSTADEKGGPVTIVISRGSETINAIAAPPWYWSDRGIAIKPHDEISVLGAMAQGKDGDMYIISRTITNHSTGDSIILRTEGGRPFWKGGQGSASHGAGSGQRRHGGGGMRGR